MQYYEFLKKYGIGLTGGIASGKTTIGKILDSMGYIVIDADRLGRKVLEPGGAGLAQVVDRFGAIMLREDGTLDRQKVAEMVFTDAQKRKQLEEIVHPLIHDQMNKELKTLGLFENPEYWFYEASLLFETGNAAKFKEVWVAYCPEKVQLKRLMHRSNVSANLAQKIIAAQMSGRQKMEMADFVINTDAPRDQLEAKVKAALENLRFRDQQEGLNA